MGIILQTFITPFIQMNRLHVHENSNTGSQTSKAEGDSLHNTGILTITTVVVITNVADILSNAGRGGEGILESTSHLTEGLGGALAGLARGGGDHVLPGLLGLLEVLGGRGAELGPVLAAGGAGVVDEVVDVVLDVVEGVLDVVAQVAEAVADVVEGVLDVVTEVVVVILGLVAVSSCFQVD
jgi:hypothetical protein